MRPTYAQIRASTQHALIEFLHAELNLGATFIESALLSRSDGHMEHYAKGKANALKAIETIKKFTLRVADVQVREEMQDRLAELERRYSTMAV